MTTWLRAVMTGGLALNLGACIQVHSAATFDTDGSAVVTSTVDVSRTAKYWPASPDSNHAESTAAESDCAALAQQLPSGFTCRDIKPGVVHYSGRLPAQSVSGLQRDGMTWTIDVHRLFDAINHPHGQVDLSKKGTVDPREIAAARSMGLALDLDLSLPGTILSVDGKPHVGEAGHARIDLLDSVGKDHCIIVARVIPRWLSGAAGTGALLLVIALVWLLRRRRG